MRLFVVVELGPDVADACARASDDLRERSATLAPRARLTWVPPQNAHVTVRFIGQADDRATRAVVEALAPPVAVDAITLFESRLSPKGPTYVPLQQTALT